jgi:dTDP-4-dehydrorhamnose 3,5-epimerase
MEILQIDIPEVKIFAPKRFEDSRGFFSETFSARAMEQAGLDLEWVQENHAFSKDAFTLRGVHYQIGADVQDKLVRVPIGSALDVAIDLRVGSKTFGKHVKTVLSAVNWRQMLVPKGFGHAIMTLEPDTHIIYRTTTFYAPDAERGIAWNDPQVGVDWGVEPGKLILSDRDCAWPNLSDQPDLLAIAPG